MKLQGRVAIITGAAAGIGFATVLDGMKSSCWLRRLAEIASIYAFLASDDASYVNGLAIEASGGMSL